MNELNKERLIKQASNLLDSIEFEVKLLVSEIEKYKSNKK